MRNGDLGYLCCMTNADEFTDTRFLRFGSLKINYDDRVLLPRPWTEMQSLWAAELSPGAPDGRILELCAGAGQIGLLAALLTDRGLVAVERHEAACGFAERNAREAGLGDRVEVRNVSLEAACEPDETFPIIIADPPWVPAAQTSRFPADPLTAIDGGPDGLDVARACLRVIHAQLDPHGFALLQLGTAEQVEVLREELPNALLMTEVRFEGDRGLVVLVVPAASHA